MGTAVERLEIWTAFALLLVALVVGAAGTLAWVAETPERTGRTRPESSTTSHDVLAQAASSIGQIGSGLVEQASSAGRWTRDAIGGLPGGSLGVVAAVLGGTLGLPLLTVAARGMRVGLRAAKKHAITPRHYVRLAALRVRALRRGGTVECSVATPHPQPDVLEQAGSPARCATACEPVAEQHFDRTYNPAPVVMGEQPAAAAPESSSHQALPDEPLFAAAMPPAGVASTHAQPQAPLEEDRALAAMQHAQSVIVSCGVHSSVLAVDIARNDAQVLFDLRPEDDATLEQAFASQPIGPQTVQQLWRPPSLYLRFVGDAPATADTSAMAVPLLALGRRGVRYVPLAGWRHLGIYGAGAHAAAHHLIATLLCQQRPDELGLAVLDRRGWASLYRNTPHWVDAPGDGAGTADALARALRRGAGVTARRTVLVLVDPDSAALSAFASLFGRLSLQTSAPVHIVLVQQRLHPLGRQLYLGLPALVTGGAAAPELLPAVRQWPRRGNAVVLVGGQRWSGRALEGDEAGAGELARRLAQFPRSTVPVLWQIPEESTTLPDRPGVYDSA